MIGLIPLYFIWKYFSELAHEYNRSRIGYFILGFVVYYAAQLVIGLLIGFGLVLTGNDESFDDYQLIISLVAVVLSFGAVMLLYRILKNAWSKKRNLEKDTQLLDD